MVHQLGLYPLDEPKKRAVGFKLSEGMEFPAELRSFGWFAESVMVT